MKLASEVPEATIHVLEKRAEKLASLVETATQGSERREIREAGTLLVERLGEWIDDIKALREVGDEDVHDVIRTFWVRLHLAEQKTERWAVPERARRGASSDRLPTRRRTARIQSPKRKLKTAA